MRKQTQIKAKTISKQEKINWSLLKRIYLQGAQKISAPQPYFEKNGGDLKFSGNWNNKWSEVEEHFKHILTEVYKKNEQFLDSFQDKFLRLNMDLRQRISRLEQQINFLKQGKQSYTGKPYKQFQQDEQIEEYRPEINPKASFIHIEQKQQESLLQGIQGSIHSTNAKRKKTSQNQDTQQQTIKKQIMKKIYFGGQSTKKQFSQNEEQKEFKYYTSLQTSQYDKNQTTFLDKNYRDLQREIYNLRKFIEQTHNVEIPTTFDQQPPKNAEKNPFNKIKNIPEIKNAEQHLRNQNSELRLIIKKYKSELIKAQYELSEIKILLQDNQNNQFEMIEI